MYYKTIPAVTFSVSRGGDWIDQHVSKVMGISRTRATALKESDVDLQNPRTREEEAIVLYYRNLIQYVLVNLKQRFELARDVPQFENPVKVVVAGVSSVGRRYVSIRDRASLGYPRTNETPAGFAGWIRILADLPYLSHRQTPQVRAAA